MTEENDALTELAEDIRAHWNPWGYGPDRLAAALLEKGYRMQPEPADVARAQRETEIPEDDEREATCVFCQKIAEGSVQREALRVFSFEPLNPVIAGHRLFVVDQHFAFPHHEPTLAGLAYSAAARHAGEAGGAYNLIVNAGSAASQTIPHVHVHYVPREHGDGIKLPWTEQHQTERGRKHPEPEITDDRLDAVIGAAWVSFTLPTARERVRAALRVPVGEEEPK